MAALWCLWWCYLCLVLLNSVFQVNIGWKWVSLLIYYTIKVCWKSLLYVYESVKPKTKSISQTCFWLVCVSFGYLRAFQPLEPSYLRSVSQFTSFLRYSLLRIRFWFCAITIGNKTHHNQRFNMNFFR